MEVQESDHGSHYPDQGNRYPDLRIRYLIWTSGPQLSGSEDPLSRPLDALSGPQDPQLSGPEDPLSGLQDPQLSGPEDPLSGADDRLSGPMDP
jgi:hypothetical protein